MLEFKGVHIGKNGNELIALNTQIKPGEILTVMGPSGSGKSTLLNWMVGQLPEVFIASGELILNQRDLHNVPTEQRRIGLMFQDPLLFPHLTVAQNISFGMSKHRRGDENYISSLLAQVGLYGIEQRMPESLSGGQKSRVSLLRLLASEPEAVLLDEPFSSLDKTNQSAVRRFVLEQINQLNVPVVLVTHDEEDAKAAGGQLIKLGSVC